MEVEKKTEKASLNKKNRRNFIRKNSNFHCYFLIKIHFHYFGHIYVLLHKFQYDSF